MDDPWVMNLSVMNLKVKSVIDSIRPYLTITWVITHLKYSSFKMEHKKTVCYWIPRRLFTHYITAFRVKPAAAAAAAAVAAAAAAAAQTSNINRISPSRNHQRRSDES